MKLKTKHPKFFDEITVYFSTIIRFLLNILLIVLVIALAVGVFKTGYDLLHSLNEPLEKLLQQMLLDIVFIVALVEIGITILGYLKYGAVHVRYIIDTILIIMLNEVVSLWFKKPDLQEAIGIAVILATLAAIRVSVIKFAPIDASQPDVK
jgi:uncharacterized membrane protein (DUF373 family)